MPTTTRAVRGFTVMELMAVAMVLAILAVAAIPSTSMTDDRKLDTFQMQIQDAIDYAQSLSYHTGAKHGVLFDVPGQWMAVINRQIVVMEDPLKRAPYIIRFDHPDQPAGLRLESAVFVDRYVAPFNEKGVMYKPGEILIRAGNSLRLLSANTATAKLIEVPIEP